MKRLSEHKQIKKYPVPGEAGGRLIREVIVFLRKQKLSLPLTSYILIATSGGADSIALAHLLLKYGRRVGTRDKIKLLHVHHGWRGKDSDGDAEHVIRLGKSFGTSAEVVYLDPGKRKPGDSWEEQARRERKRVFENFAKRFHAWVLTAHHADDLAETMLWRILTGAVLTHGQGIQARSGVEIRPLLRVRKNLLCEYLKEEGQGWREDVTNEDPRFLRARMRKELMKPIEVIFPRAVEHLVDLALKAKTFDSPQVGGVLQSLGLKLNRTHWEAITRMSRGDQEGGVTLTQGWQLSCDQDDSWRLEKIKRNS